MDNLSSHKAQRFVNSSSPRALISVTFRPTAPTSTRLKNAFAKLKALLRKAAKRTIEGLWSSIGELLTAFKLTNAKTTSPQPDTMQNDGIPL
jgi:hypothetical protein